MSLIPGDLLGPYEIVSALGAGGMGEVYRARDTKLGRDVAIKVLPEALSADTGALARFEREARAVAALSHSNILAIHDFGTHGNRAYAVMELLEGQTLLERLVEAPLTVRKSVEFAAQIARGLAAAHEKGIVHRDLKPANIFVTEDGRIKILDFGIARFAAGEESSTGGPPDSILQTEPGTVLGTVGYMAPEQVRGKRADARSDIFSLGAVLYEMLTGMRAFQRESGADTIGAILREEPPEVSRVNRNVPAEVERIVRRCLEKNPSERFQSARDLAFDLEDLAASSGPVDLRRRFSLRAPSHRAIAFGGIILVLLTTAVIAGFATTRLARRQPASFRQLTFRHGRVGHARFTQDGQTIVYSAAWGERPVEIHSTRADGLGSRTLGLPAADLLSISPVGEMAILLKPRPLAARLLVGTLARVPLAGGAPREIVEDATDADLDSRGAAAVVRRVADRDRLEFPVGRLLYETTGYIDSVRFSPKGDRLAFLDHPIYPDDRGSVAIVDRAGNKRTLTREWNGTHGLAWSADGEEIWFAATGGGEDRSVYAVTLAGHQRSLLPAPIDLAVEDISQAGAVLLAREYSRTVVVAHGPEEADERDLSWFSSEAIRALSNDGRTLIVSQYGEGSGDNYGLYLRRTDGSPAVRLGEGEGIAISPDTRWILSMMPVTRQLVLWPSGAGEPKKIALGRVSYQWKRGTGWSPEGSRIFFAGLEPGHAIRSYWLNSSGGDLRAATAEGTTIELVSPDGRLLLLRGSRGTLSLQPLEGGEQRAIPGLAEGEAVIQWEATGRALYIANSSFPMAIHRLDLETGRRTLWKEIGPADRAGLAGGSVFLTPDGKSYAYSYRRTLSDLYLVDGLK